MFRQIVDARCNRKEKYIFQADPKRKAREEDESFILLAAEMYPSACRANSRSSRSVFDM